jgi:hypothetical protein
MASVVDLKPGRGHYVALFHDDGRFIANGGKATGTFTIYETLSSDVGLTWPAPEVVVSSSVVSLREPGAFRSPDGRQIAMLLRENTWLKHSHVIVSDDEGRTWKAPREVSRSPAIAISRRQHRGMGRGLSAASNCWLMARSS